MFDAFRDRDAAEVGRLARDHCQHTRDRLIASLRRQQA
jgi:hypothetical protein